MAQDVRLAARLGEETEGGFGFLKDLVASPDGAYVAFPSGGAELVVLDTGSWLSTRTIVCGTTAGIAMVDTDSGVNFYTGCEDGTVAVVGVSDQGNITTGTPITVGDTPVWAVESDGSILYAIYGDSSSFQASAIDLSTSTVVSGWPVSFPLSSVEDSVLLDGLLVGIDGDATFIKVDTATLSVSTTYADLTYMHFIDTLVYGNYLYFADSGGTFGYIVSSSDTYSGVVTLEPTVTAIGISYEEDTFFASTDTDTHLYSLSSGLTGEKVSAISGAGNITEYASFSGYTLAGNSDGEVLVLTTRPWITVESISPSSAASGDTGTIVFSSDTDGSYTVRVNGGVDGSGALIAEGDINAGEELSADFTVGDSFIEGNNRVWVFVDGWGGTGHAAGVVSINNPPGAVVLSGGFGEESISLSFTALEDADVSSYQLYLTVTPFEGEAWETGGPEFDGSDDITVGTIPTTPSESVSYTIDSLTNGVTYYAAVRAVDSSGLEGPMSNVVSLTPQHTMVAAELAGDPGGFCGAGPSASGLALLIGAIAGLVRRRSAVAGVVLVGLALPQTALAKEKKPEESPQSYGASARFGPLNLGDKNLEAVYGSRNLTMLRLDYGFCNNWAELNLGVGLVRKTGEQVAADGTSSEEYAQLTLLPLTLDATGRLDFFYEQPIVPFARLGGDMWLWREGWGSPDAEASVPYDHIGGGKYGWHYAAGLMLLLDSLDRDSANRFDATAGINDTYLIAEFRQTSMFNTTGLDFSGTEFSFGLKFDF
jgi:hypothetical protein